MFLDTFQLSQLGAAAGFSLCFPTASYLFNKRICAGNLDTGISAIGLLASLVFCTAIIFEASINALYQAIFQRQLWVYRAFPLHQGSVSALAILVWGSYGVHLYFLNQTLDRWLGGRPCSRLLKAGRL